MASLSIASALPKKLCEQIQLFDEDTAFLRYDQVNQDNVDAWKLQEGALEEKGKTLEGNKMLVEKLLMRGVERNPTLEDKKIAYVADLNKENALLFAEIRRLEESNKSAEVLLRFERCREMWNAAKRDMEENQLSIANLCGRPASGMDNVTGEIVFAQDIPATDRDKSYPINGTQCRVVVEGKRACHGEGSPSWENYYSWEEVGEVQPAVETARIAIQKALDAACSAI
jgi:hypothetical protein